MNPADKGPGILDTSTVILLPQISNSCALPSEPMITAITLAELAAGSILASTHAERTYRQAQLKQAKADFHIIPFDKASAASFAKVAYDLRKSGRKTSARSYDALIAAIAIAHRLPLYTTNPKDFITINELQLVPIPHPDQPLHR